MRNAILFVPIIALFGCGEAPPSAEQAPTSADSSKTMISVDLAEQQMPLFVEVGDAATLGTATPSVMWNEVMGRVELQAGEHFAITVMEEEADLARVKAGFDHDMLQKHTIIEETPDKLVYRSEFPDDAIVFIHFYQVVRAGARTFVVQDNPNMRFTEADVARMAKAVRAEPSV
ncbi:MAG TPA: hypothetical protein PK760_04760 [Flavobacteriales bacterium]|nr:hypothetical protein [Flavobacteriales bacterium]